MICTTSFLSAACLRALCRAIPDIMFYRCVQITPQSEAARAVAEAASLRSVNEELEGRCLGLDALSGQQGEQLQRQAQQLQQQAEQLQQLGERLQQQDQQLQRLQVGRHEVTCCGEQEGPWELSWQPPRLLLMFRSRAGAWWYLSPCDKVNWGAFAAWVCTSDA